MTHTHEWLRLTIWLILTIGALWALLSANGSQDKAGEEKRASGQRQGILKGNKL